MPKYKEQNITGKKHRRSNRVVIDNPEAGVQSIAYEEEDVFTIGNDKSRRPAGQVKAILTTENALDEYPLVDPETDQPTGEMATYQDLYVRLHSMYLHLAGKRDAGE